MSLTALKIFKESAQQCVLVDLQGNQGAEIKGINAFQNGRKGDLVCVPDLKSLQKTPLNEIAAIVCPKEVASQINGETPHLAVLVSAYLPLSHALLKQKYFDRDYSKSGWKGIHPSAIVHESVQIPNDCTIGPHVIIEQGVSIGQGCQILSRVTIEHDSLIGSNCILHPGVMIGYESKLGDQVQIFSNTVVGSEGFGFSQDQNFNHYRIPQTGNVVIENKVRIGANNTIDRGTYGPTTIGEGTIIDNLCHIAHNVKIGKNCILLAGFLCAGSSTLGDRVVASGGTMIKDHVNICSDVYLMHRAGVIKDIKEKGMYAGAPVLAMKQYVKTQAIYNDLPAMRTLLKSLENRIS